MFEQKREEIDPQGVIPLPRWIAKYQEFEATALSAELKRVASLEPDLVSFEGRFRLLERFEAVRDELLRNAHGRPVAADKLYQQFVLHYGAMASYGTIYSRLAANGHLDLAPINSVLDLGPGYWNSASIYDSIFPKLEIASGIECDQSKADRFNNRTGPMLGVDGAKFRMHKADFFDLLTSQTALQSLTGRATFDLVLLQSYFPGSESSGSLYHHDAKDPRSFRDYDQLLDAMPSVLGDRGFCIAMLDAPDIAASPTLTHFAHRLRERSAVVVNDTRLGINPRWGGQSLVDVKIFILRQRSES